MKVRAVAFHRNGVFGEGFHVVAFDWRDGRKVRRMVATVFDGPGRVAVLDVDRAQAGDIAMGSNSWRGDHFEPELRHAVAAWDAAEWTRLTAGAPPAGSEAAGA